MPAMDLDLETELRDYSLTVLRYILEHITGWAYGSEPGKNCDKRCLSIDEAIELLSKESEDDIETAISDAYLDDVAELGDGWQGGIQ